MTSASVHYEMDMEIDDVYDPIAALSALNPDPHRHYEILRHQIIHRQKILQQWGGIRRGSKVLELGCGQGDCTIVLAEAVGEEGHVVAVDPGDKDYGASFGWKRRKLFKIRTMGNNRLIQIVLQVPQLLSAKHKV